jgi:superfamily II DNA or RNA helicase
VEAKPHIHGLRANRKRKTGLAAFITAGLVSRGMRVLFVAPYTILINQTAQRFTEYGLPEDQISFIWRDHPNYDPNLLIQIASADTLIRREFPKNIDLLIVDEAHLRKRRILKEIERITAEKKRRLSVYLVPLCAVPGPLLSTPD